MAKWVKGKKARFVCDRSGFEYPYKEGVLEPGTGYFVHRSETDGMYNLKDHPHNYPPAKKIEGLALRHARPEVLTGVRDEFLLNESSGVLLLENGDPLYNEDN